MWSGSDVRSHQKCTLVFLVSSSEDNTIYISLRATETSIRLNHGCSCSPFRSVIAKRDNAISIAKIKTANLLAVRSRVLKG